MKYRYILLQFVLSLLISMPLSAFEVNVVDQYGKPVKDAFVAIPKGNIVAPPNKSAVMDQIDVQFVPHVLAIEQGQAVVFPNSDNIRHHVYSFSKPKKFEIKLYQGVPEQPIYFEEPGIVALGCNIHDSMLGYIYVSPWPHFALSDEKGQVSFAESADEIVVWHPRLKGSQELVREQISQDAQSMPVEVSLSLKKPKKRKSKNRLRKAYDF